MNQKNSIVVCVPDLFMIKEIGSGMPLSTYPSLPATSSLMTKPLPPSAAVDLTQVFKTLMGKALHLLVSGEKP